MNKFAYIFLIILLIAIIFVGGIFLSLRLSFYFEAIDIKYLYILFGAISLGSILVLNPAHSASPVAGALYTILMPAFGFVAYLLLFTIIFDLLNIFVKFPPHTIGMFVMSSSIVVSIYGLIKGQVFKQTVQDIILDKVQKEFTIGHLSDIHLGHFRGRKYFQRIVNQVRKAKPDIVIITGDFIDSEVAIIRDDLSPLKYLDMPVYYCEGNHDRSVGNEIVEKTLKKYGVRLLQNEVEHLENGIQLIGINHINADHNSYDPHADGEETVSTLLPKIKISKDLPSILLHHTPEGVKYMNELGVDLVLSGHTHAGQMFPFNLFANLIFPFNKGVYNYKDTQVFISQGIGTYGPPMRVGTSNEFVLLKIKGKNIEEAKIQLPRYENG
jgi:uncharacterized protein